MLLSLGYTDVVSFPTGKLAGRSTAGTGALEAITVGSGLSLSGGTLTSSAGDTVISPSQLTASQDDWSPTGLSTATIIRLSGDSSLREITSIAAQASRRLMLINIGANTVMLRDQWAALGTAANRILCGGFDLPLFPDGSINLIYDDTSSRWRVVNPLGYIIPSARFGVYVTDANTPATGTQTPLNLSSSTSGAGAGAAVTLDATLGHYVLYVETGTATTGRGALVGNNGNNYRLLSSLFWRYTFRLKAPAASDGTDTYTLRVGLLDASSGDATDGVYLRYTHSVNSGNWELVLRNNTSESAVNLSAGPTASTWDLYSFVISPTKVEVFKNSVSIGSTTTLTNLPTARDTDIGASITKSAGSTTRVCYQSSIELVGYLATP